MSAGLTARRYWCSMLKLGASYQQLLAKVGHLGAPSPHELGAGKGPLPHPPGFGPCWSLVLLEDTP